MQVGWDDCEFGAPRIDCKRPYGNSDVYKDMIILLGIKTHIPEDCDELPPKILLKLDNLHKETETALQIVLSTGSFEAGMYEADDYSTNWRKAR
jgi:hypothetical protein